MKYDKSVYDINKPNISIHLCNFCKKFFDGDLGDGTLGICDNCMIPKQIIDNYPRLKKILEIRKELDQIDLMKTTSKENAISLLDKKYELEDKLKELNK